MASTSISFITDEGQILSNLNWLSLATGDTIAFEAPGTGIPPVVFFSPDLISILTPTPPQHLVVDSTLPPYTVISAQPGGYTIVVGSSAETLPYFPERSSTNLFCQSTPIAVGTPILPPVRSGS